MPSLYHKFILLLSSENDGEVLAAVRAIGRKLKADGKDWYWFADQFGKPAPAPQPILKSGGWEFRGSAQKSAAAAYSDFVKEFDEAVKRAEKTKGWRPGGAGFAYDFRKQKRK